MREDRVAAEGVRRLLFTWPSAARSPAPTAGPCVGGVSAKAGFTTTNLQEAQMIQSAQRTIAVMHSSKFGRSAFAHIVRLDAVELLITDRLPEPELRDALTAAEVEIVVASGISGPNEILTERLIAPTTGLEGRPAGLVLKADPPLP